MNSNSQSNPRPPNLTAPRKVAEQRLTAHIEAGKALMSLESPSALDEAFDKKKRWSNQSIELLGRLFDNDFYVSKYDSHFNERSHALDDERNLHYFKHYLAKELSVLEMALDATELAEESRANRHEDLAQKQLGRKVFVVHGRDNASKQSVCRFLEKLGLEPVVLHEQPNKGRTIIEKFEAYADVGYAVVLLTPDDIGHLASSPEAAAPRARQNVVLEWGYFAGRLGREHVCALYTPGVDIPSDYDGLVYVQLDEAEGWKLRLGKELKAAGVEVDLNLAV